MEEKPKQTIYNNFNRINKPLYIYGLSIAQFLGTIGGSLGVVILGMFVLKSILITLLILGLIIPVIVYIFKKIAKHNKAGDPNYMDSLMSYNKVRKEFIDSNKILVLLNEGRKRDRDIENISNTGDNR